jgi:hypothetical protein
MLKGCSCAKQGSELVAMVRFLQSMRFSLLKIKSERNSNEQPDSALKLRSCIKLGSRKGRKGSGLRPKSLSRRSVKRDASGLRTRRRVWMSKTLMPRRRLALNGLARRPLMLSKATSRMSAAVTRSVIRSRSTMEKVQARSASRKTET